MPTKEEVQKWLDEMGVYLENLDPNELAYEEACSEVIKLQKLLEEL